MIVVPSPGNVMLEASIAGSFGDTDTGLPAPGDAAAAGEGGAAGEGAAAGAGDAAGLAAAAGAAGTGLAGAAVATTGFSATLVARLGVGPPAWPPQPMLDRMAAVLATPPVMYS